MNNKEKNEPLMKSIIIMRHGERIDCIDEIKKEQVLSEYDPELTKKGIKQAQDIGMQIKKSLKNNMNILNIYTSPLTRTIMTGINLAKKLNLEKNNFYIINSLFEIASKNNFKYFPLNSLLINNKFSQKNLYEKYILNDINELNNCTFNEINKNKNQQSINYPEDFNDAIKRYKDIARVLFDEIVKNENNSLNVIVTHGYGVQVITEFLFGKTCNEEELLKKEIFFVDYCTSYCFNFVKNNEIKFIGRIEPSFD